MDRLGGPPGLYDSPNRDRESTGGIVLRVRVPDAGRDMIFPIGPFNPLSLNDSDNVADMMGDPKNPEQAQLIHDALENGIPYRKSISGDKM